MKAITLSFLFFLFHALGLRAQVEIKDGLYFNKSGRQVWITTMDGSKTPRALLYKVSKDSVFYVLTGVKTIQPQQEDLEIESLHYMDIKSLITLRNSPGRQGALVGGLFGVPIGLALNAAADNTVENTPVFGVVFADAYNQPSMVMASVLFGAGIGAGSGALIGKGAKKSWQIEGSKLNYEEFILELDQRAFWNRASRPRASSKK